MIVFLFRSFTQIKSVVLLICTVPIVTGYPTYQTYIPNGQRVPNPCQPGTVWQGVGHKNPAGGGPRNPFGLDFAANEHVNCFFMLDISIAFNRCD